MSIQRARLTPSFELVLKPSKSVSPMTAGKRELRILIVEDNKLDEFLLIEALQHLERPIRISIVNNLKDAEYYLNQESYDIIFMDLHLPDSANYQTSLDLVDRYRATQKFIVMSGIEDWQKVKSSFDAGASNFLPKETLSRGHLPQDLERMVETCRTQKPPSA